MTAEKRRGGRTGRMFSCIRCRHAWMTLSGLCPHCFIEYWLQRRNGVPKNLREQLERIAEEEKRKP